MPDGGAVVPDGWNDPANGSDVGGQGLSPTGVGAGGCCVVPDGGAVVPDGWNDPANGSGVVGRSVTGAAAANGPGSATGRAGIGAGRSSKGTRGAAWAAGAVGADRFGWSYGAGSVIGRAGIGAG